MDQSAREQLTPDHEAALDWFREHTGERVSWTVLQDHATNGPRLVTQAKGIYKPAYTDYALSVRQTLGGPYADREVMRRADGAWTYEYFQENPDPTLRDREPTNRGLMKCLEDRVPVGVLLQVKPKPGVEYEVLGLAHVTGWSNGYFLLKGVPAEGSAIVAREVAATVADPDPGPAFNPDASDADLRVRTIVEVARRRGQPAFRAALMRVYRSRCVVTGCDAQEALEAAHISPYRGDATNHVQNGLLLRADIHSLFDIGLLSIDPDTRCVRLSATLIHSSYADMEGVRVAEPIEAAARASEEALRRHFRWSSIPGAQG